MGHRVSTDRGRPREHDCAPPGRDGVAEHLQSRREGAAGGVVGHAALGRGAGAVHDDGVRLLLHGLREESRAEPRVISDCHFAAQLNHISYGI